MATLTSTRALTINAAFLLEIKEDNRELKRLLGLAMELMPRLTLARGCGRQVAELMSRLRDQLALHFSLEEAFGYFEDAVEVAPRLSERADELRQEHESLFLEMCRIAEEADELRHQHARPSSYRRVGLKFVAFHHQFQAHEGRENDLILEALGEDIGVGD